MVEIIGFIISLLALLYILIKQTVPTQRPGQPPVYPEEEEIEEDPFREFMKAVEREAAARKVAQRVPPPPPPPKITKRPKKAPLPPSLEEYRLASQLEDRRLRSSLEERHLKSRLNHREERPGGPPALPVSPLAEEEKKRHPSRAQMAIQRLAHRQDMIIYQEVIGKPKSLRPYS
jgi:hypothetical protein